MKIIAHIDMDAFFASVEERANPQFHGLPLVVGADPKGGKGRGVVSTANYPARAYGIHSALPISTAWRLSEGAVRNGCPPVIFLPVDFELYKDVSRRIMAGLRARVPHVEEASVDEAYLDLSFLKNIATAEILCRTIKKEIVAREGVTASIGIGPNKLIAKICSSHEKPNGLTIVQPERVLDFLAPLSVREIPGIGPKTGESLRAQNIMTIGDLRSVSLEELMLHFGKWGAGLYQKSRGIDDDPVREDHEIQSIGEQETFERDTLHPVYLSEHLLSMCERVCSRVTGEGFTGFKTVLISVRFSDFQTHTRSFTLGAYTNKVEVMKAQVLRLFLPFLDVRENPRKKLIRLLGVRVEKLRKRDEDIACVNKLHGF